ncbi:MAG: gliding motility-associated C-terminal domain-containing protein, partial [Bacteroidetes bacterium]|nr:gliding motility-associated C-terminal domain-containing protein [Bacteroidota bacterium]
MSASLLCAQTHPCDSLGQRPTTAFPVCGSDTFVQTSVPQCYNNSIPLVPPCPNDGNVYRDLNPYWYKFTCFTAGTLGLTIQPNNPGDDYDWQIWDITGHDPNDVYTDKSLTISFNWSGETGTTGASAAGTQAMVCGSTGGGQVRPLFSSMPTLIKDHQYLLMISHFLGDQQSGYKLSFGGGTASITDPKLPALVDAKASCDGYTVTVVTNKKMKCNTLAGNGSDFTVNGYTITGATGAGCSAGFDTDTILLKLSAPMTPGNYNVTMHIGTDNTTLLDNCNRDIPNGSSVPLAVLPVQPTPMDSLTPPKCAPQTISLVFKKNIKCSSIEPQGSDFVITGPSPVTVTSATGNCSNGVTGTITLHLASPVVNKGTYQVTLQRGTDNNTIIDECGQETPAGATLSFTVQDTVSAEFTYSVAMGCKQDTVNFRHDGAHDVNQWFWQFDTSGTSTLQNPQKIFSVFGNKPITLTVSNGFCRDSSTQVVNLDNQLTAAFYAPLESCPEDAVTFTDQSVGKIVSWYWSFGDSTNSLQQNPPPKHYPITGRESWYTAYLIVRNTACADTSTRKIKIYKTCYIAVPSAFTPNGDGNNDYLYPLNAYKADHLEFKVFNRLGQLVFQTTDWTIHWDGRVNGHP